MLGFKSGLDSLCGTGLDSTTFDEDDENDDVDVNGCDLCDHNDNVEDDCCFHNDDDGDIAEDNNLSSIFDDHDDDDNDDLSAILELLNDDIGL